MRLIPAAGRLVALMLFCVRATAGNAEIPVRDPTSGEVIARLEASVYLPTGPGPFPVAILSHGSAGGSPKTSIPWKGDGEYLASRGYVVVAPMRRGRGKSTGTSPESEDKNCDPESWYPGLRESMRDLDATVEFTHSLPNARIDDLTLIGVSRGGFLSIAYSAEGKHRSEVRKVVNFVGGWVAQAEDQCSIDFNLVAFRRYGAETKIPMLWLYGARDLFYGDSAVKDYARAFTDAGGIAHFHLIPDVPDNGHWLPQYPAKWRSLVDRFLLAPDVP